MFGGDKMKMCTFCGKEEGVIDLDDGRYLGNNCNERKRNNFIV